MLIFSLVGTLFFLTQLLQSGYEMSPLRASLVLVPGLAISVLASFIVIPIARRFSLRSVIAGGLTVSASGLALISQLPAQDGVLLALLAFAAVGLGSGMAETVTNSAVLSAAPPHRRRRRVRHLGDSLRTRRRTRDRSAGQCAQHRLPGAADERCA